MEKYKSEYLNIKYSKKYFIMNQTTNWWINDTFAYIKTAGVHY